MKIVDNFRIFKKIIRKFYKKNTIKHIVHTNGKCFVSYWEHKDWLYFIVDNIEQLNKEITKYIILILKLKFWKYFSEFFRFNHLYNTFSIDFY